MTLDCWDLDSNLQTLEFVDNDTDTYEMIDISQYFDFEIIYTDDDAVVPAHSGIVDGGDKIYYEYYNEPYTMLNKNFEVRKLFSNQEIGRVDWEASFKEMVEFYGGTHFYKDLLPSKIDHNGRFIHRNNSITTISATTHGIKHSVDVSVEGYPQQRDVYDYDLALWILKYPEVSFKEYVSGWLLKHIADEIDNRIALGGDKEIYSTQDHTTPSYIRNTNCWGYGLDLTSISPWNSDLEHRKAGILITPCHIVEANHYPIAIGSTIRFITVDNTIVTRTVVSDYQITDPGSDIRIAKLDSDVPSSISFAKILPQNMDNYFPEPQWWIPVFKTDQEEKLLCSELYNDDANNLTIDGDYRFCFRGNGLVIKFNSSHVSMFDTRLPYYEIWVSGDSGSPCFMIINGEVVILFCAYLPMSGPYISAFKDSINTALTSLGGGYQLTEVDLSSFRSLL